ncbi:MAG: hypothetical protein F4Z83_11325, partial [Gemmatimonadetes bacterium]|nr:hypothetical protein [Gemmatimonadota bacterium]
MSDDLFELGERIAQLAARINIATFDMLTLVAEFDRRKGWADNFASCAEWLAWRTGRTLAAARGDIAAHGVRRRAGRDGSPGRGSGERGAADAHHPPAHPPRARGTGPGV